MSVNNRFHSNPAGPTEVAPRLSLRTPPQGAPALCRRPHALLAACTPRSPALRFFEVPSDRTSRALFPHFDNRVAVTNLRTQLLLTHTPSPLRPSHSNAAAALSIRLAKNITTGRTIRCAAENILRAEGVRTAPIRVDGKLQWHDNIDSLGDGFGHLYPNATDYIQRILATPLDDSAIRVPSYLLAGVNVWTLTEVAELGNFSVEYYVVRLRPEIWAARDKVIQLQYIFDVLGYDCLWTATLLQPDRTAFMNFSAPRHLQQHCTHCATSCASITARTTWPHLALTGPAQRM